MEKNLLKGLFFSALLLLSACNIPDSYIKKNIEIETPRFIKEQLGLETKVWLTGETLWIYAPLENVVENGQYTKEFEEKFIFLLDALPTFLLSIDKPPRFYVLVLSDIKASFDIRILGYVPDLIEFNLRLISSDDIRDRQALFIFPAVPQAHGDTQGLYFDKYDVTMEEFISYLIKSDIEKTFNNPAFKDTVEMRELNTYYEQSMQGVKFDIYVKKYEAGVPYPFDAVKNSVKRVLSIYENTGSVKTIEITNLATKKTTYFTSTELLKGK